MHRSWVRHRHALAFAAPLLLISLATSACGGGGQAEDSGASSGDLGSLKVSAFPIVDLAAMYVGVRDGAFADAGLEVTPTTIAGSGAATLAALQSGALDVAASNLVSVLQTNAAGNDVKCFAAVTRKPSDGRQLALLTGADSGITEPAQLAGKSIAVNAVGSVNELVADAWLRDNGVEPTSVEFVAVNFPQMAQVLESGDVDAAMVDEPYTTIATNAGVKVLAPRPYEAVAPSPVFNCWAATSDEIAEKGPALQAFVTAMDEANKSATDDANALQQALVQDIKLSDDVASAVTVPVYDTAITVEDIDAWNVVATDFGFLPQPVDSASVLVAP